MKGIDEAIAAVEDLKSQCALDEAEATDPSIKAFHNQHQNSYWRVLIALEEIRNEGKEVHKGTRADRIGLALIELLLGYVIATRENPEEIVAFLEDSRQQVINKTLLIEKLLPY